MLALAAPLIGVLVMLSLLRLETWLVADVRKVRFAAPTVDGRSLRLPRHHHHDDPSHTDHLVLRSQVGSGAAEFGDFRCRPRMRRAVASPRGVRTPSRVGISMQYHSNERRNHDDP